MSSPAADQTLSQTIPSAENRVSPSQPAAPQQPQLIKTAVLQLTVKSIASSLDQVKTIVQTHQGDILNLQDELPTDYSSHRLASLQIRIPQAKLDATLQSLKQLGTVDSQSVTAEDVSTQLVDYQARLKNLRKTEETLLGIMERSGSVGDVLKVAQELSQVRSMIEQISAQLATLQNQVSYSTIRLNLTEIVASIRTQPATEVQIENTWESATHSFSKLTVDLLQLGIWLLVYSPYWVVLGAIASFTYLRLRRNPVQSRSEES
jgi:hypothetical protein